MNFQESIKTCFNKYADFSGRASRPEYWWFALFVFLGCVVTSLVSHWLYIAFALGTLVPQLAAAARRLHDTGRSGWWQLIALIPLIGTIVLIVFLAQESSSEGEALIGQ
ncbi:DUF805 domain-containing protein [Roseateles sp. BYS78W]|uniref:DUF805 domain-containing protein n=1 Tax=Pelomonas candidula TaxID=3299025 RepID=A0ABW7H758_9BURK